MKWFWIFSISKLNLLLGEYFPWSLKDFMRSLSKAALFWTKIYNIGVLITQKKSNRNYVLTMRLLILLLSLNLNRLSVWVVVFWKYERSSSVKFCFAKFFFFMEFLILIDASLTRLILLIADSLWIGNLNTNINML